MAAPAARAPRRDALAEQQLVRELWQQVEARIDSSSALRAFLTQKIDDCGQTVAFEAFDLVRLVLNPEGFVRRAHQSSDQSLGDAIAMSESPWAVEGSLVDRQWDFNGRWHKNRKYWPKINKYDTLEPTTIERFCRPQENLLLRKREQSAQYIDGREFYDDEFSIPAMSYDQNLLEILNELPDDSNAIAKPVRRWETFRSNFPKEGYEALILETKWTGSLRKLNFEQIIHDKIFDLKNSIEYDIAILGSEDQSDFTTQLEPYWRLAWRSQDWTQSENFKNYGYGSKHKMCNLQEKPDLILEVGYFNADSGLFSTRVVMCEFDDKEMTKAKMKDNSMKLALKLMSSFVAQNSVQAETYHIRTNYAWYFTKLIDMSLLSTTKFELPEVTELIRLYGKDTQSTDYKTLHHTIHFMHHMFAAHVKIAFLIYMQVVHDIDMRNMDKQDFSMRNNCFFVNFEANNLPQELVFQDKMPEATKTWLETHEMMHTRVQIKTYQEDVTNEWVEAPVLDASSARSAMKSWKARVASAPLPRFPYEKRVCVPVFSATIQRVNMQKIVQIVIKAADKARDLYYEALKLQKLNTKVLYEGRSVTLKVKRRQFPDRCFLTRKEQYDKTKWWNIVEHALRKRQPSAAEDLLEFTWGYEKPTLKRQFNIKFEEQNAEENAWTHWDQLDVRMYFFNKAMQSDPSWKDAINGIWYVQDYIDFFNMLRKLQVPDDLASYEVLSCTLVPEQFNASQYDDTIQDQQRTIHKQKSLMLSKYAFRTKNGTSDDPGENYKFFICQQNNDMRMPRLLAHKERAYHMFAVLSWFFDCRDSGACRWQWEDYVLKYFGAELQGDNIESDFHKFEFTKKEASEEIDVEYFDKPWFVMNIFMEINFRNALTAIHYKLWDTIAETNYIPCKNPSSLQAKAKELYNRQHSLLNTRARCVGLQGVSAGLSWQKNPARNCLRNLLLSSLDDTLPGLDPQLETYLRQFNAPNAGLFLRMIEVSNVLALRELALQHKLVSQSEPGASKLEARLAWFEPAVQSEIRHLMHCVERDDSVFVAAPVVHPTKAIVLEEELMRKWVRQTLGVHQHLHSLRCPLDVKFHLFTTSETYRVLMQLFCTKTQLDNSHTQRPVLYVLLQVFLAAEVLKGTIDWNNLDKQDTAVNKILRTNPVMEMLDIEDLKPEHSHVQYKIDMLQNEDLLCTPGSSLATWPLRDQNLWCKLKRGSKKAAVYQQNTTTLKQTIEHGGLKFTVQETPSQMMIKYPKENDQITRDMKDKELRHWLLLACARPGPCKYVRQDDGRFTANDKKHELTVQDCTVRQQAEWPHESDTGRQRDTIIASVESFEVVQNRLQVTLRDDADTHIFFETVKQPKNDPEIFPEYIKEIITEIPNRTRIYIPKVFAKHLRKEKQNLHNQIYFYNKKYWQMVCVGYRAWAWKRLLVKSIFFDALTKVVTRSSVVLSLLLGTDYLELDKDPKVLSNFYQKRIADTKDTFGDLQLKIDKLKRNFRNKTMQLVLTISLTKKRAGKIDHTNFLFHNLKKIFLAEQQFEWCKYYQTNNPEEMTCRFLLINNRMYQFFLKDIKIHDVKDCDVLQYRSYLYLVSENMHLLRPVVISLQGKLYVKFPKEYAVLKRKKDGDLKTGKVEDVIQNQYVSTCWDCRRYSCMKPGYLLVPDSEITSKLFLQVTPVEALFHKLKPPVAWRSFSSDDLQTCKYILQNTTQHVNYFKKQMFPFVEHGTGSIREFEQDWMYTLPDVFFCENKSYLDYEKIPKIDDWTINTFFQDLLLHENAQHQATMWNNLRNSSKYIALDISNVPNQPTTAINVLDTGEANFEEPFKEIMMTLRRRILPNLFENS